MTTRRWSNAVVLLLTLLTVRCLCYPSGSPALQKTRPKSNVLDRYLQFTPNNWNPTPRMNSHLVTRFGACEQLAKSYAMTPNHEVTAQIPDMRGAILMTFFGAEYTWIGLVPPESADQGKSAMLNLWENIKAFQQVQEASRNNGFDGGRILVVASKQHMEEDNNFRYIVESARREMLRIAPGLPDENAKIFPLPDTAAPRCAVESIVDNRFEFKKRISTLWCDSPDPSDKIAQMNLEFVSEPGNGRVPYYTTTLGGWWSKGP